MYTSIIIITKDRIDQLKDCLASIGRQTKLPDEIIIVDGSLNNDEAKNYINDFGGLNIQYFSCAAGMTKQRNLGIKKIYDQSKITIFCDDDIELETNALAKTINFFQKNPSAVGLTGDFILEPKSSLAKIILGTFSGLYTAKTFGISCGLFNIINGDENIKEIDWLSGAYMAIRTNVVRQHFFDEWYTDYGLGEDLDYSLQIKKMGSLYYSPDIKIKHFRFRIDFNWQNFGYQRIVNRYYIYKKHFTGNYYYWLGYWWANFWLLIFNIFRGIIIKKFRQQLAGNLQGLSAVLFHRHLLKIP